MAVKAQPRDLSGPLQGGQPGATVVVEPLEAGRMLASRSWLERSGGERMGQLRMFGFGTSKSSWLTLPCPVFLITHPTAGPLIADTGLHPSVTAKPSANLGRLNAHFSHAELDAGQDVPAQLRARGLDAREISTVVMTHLHFDHASGMAEFADSTFIVSAREWEAATTTSQPIMHGYRRAHYDYAFDFRTVDFDGPSVDSYSTFGRTFDLFGDGSVRLAFTPGHTLGHMSLICRLKDRDLVIAGDAIYTLGQLGDAPPPPRPEDPHTWRRSRQELALFQREYPQAVIFPGHDPDAWASREARYE